MTEPWVECTQRLALAWPWARGVYRTPVVSMPEAVRVSVCMPTYRRPAALERALDCLTHLRAPDGGYEILVVDDGSPAADNVEEVLRRAQRSSTVPIRWTALERNRGPAAARNEAWRTAVGEWVAFTDDDCQVSTDWLTQLLDVAERTGASVVEGRTEPDPTQASLLTAPFARSVRVEGNDGYFRTCNILYRADLLRELDGFDEKFRLIADDTDLGWRAEQAGATVAFAPAALVHHDVVVGTWKTDLRSRRRWADVVRMVAKHPGARRLAWKPYIYRKSHVPVLATGALIPLLVPRRSRRLALLGITAILARDSVSAGSPRGALVALQQRLSDGYEIALLLRESARYRTLLL